MLGALLVVLGCAASAPNLAGPALPDVDGGAPLEIMPADPGKDPTDVALRFAWPAPASGRCATVARRIEAAGSQTVRTAQSVRVERDGDQLRVESYDPEIPHDAPRAVIPLAETWYAERLIGPEGRLLRAGTLDGALGSSDRTLVSARLAQRWQSLVGAWAGRTLPMGVTYKATAPEQTAEGPVRLQLAVRADGYVPCEPGAEVARCVRLRILSQPSPSDAPLVARMAARDLLSRDAFMLYESSRVRAFEAQTMIVLVTEPGTLLPHRVSERRVLRLRIDPLVGDDGVDLDRRDEVTQVCAWQARR